MQIYESSKEAFIDVVRGGKIDQVLIDFYYKATGKMVGKAEQESWKKSMRYMRDVLRDREIPADAGVSIEYHIPHTSMRVDFILTGQDVAGIDHALLIELKQWSEAQLSHKDGIVSTKFFGEVSHPSYQAWSYAALLQGFSETVEQQSVQLKPCAYLHNYISDDVIKNPVYGEYLAKAPVFLEGDEEKEKLQAFIKRFVHRGDKTRLMYRIDGGRFRPSKGLAESLARMLEGNKEFILIDEQKVVYETALSLAKESSAENKNVLIIRGGPGTGKSVVAINLLVALTKLRLWTQYVTKNLAPRAVFECMLTGKMTKTEIASLFAGSGSFTEAPKNAFDALVVDEAHRLNEKSGIFRHLGENQIKEIVEASKFSVFFIDEDQRVTWHDIGEVGEIKRWATVSGAKVQVMDLSSQFRCNGSDGYLAWLDDTLQIRETANPVLDVKEYDFQVVDSPTQLQELVFKKNREKNRARMVAGYCWEWVSKKNKALLDIRFPEHGFAMRWNLESDGGLWILGRDSVNEVGCIHTCQGLEMDYVGVIVGPDLIVRNGNILTVPEKRAKSDASIKGYKTLLAKDPGQAAKKADAIIKNTYRTLMTRGMKGCYVYFTDKETEEYFKNRARPRVLGGW